MSSSSGKLRQKRRGLVSNRKSVWVGLFSDRKRWIPGVKKELLLTVTLVRNISPFVRIKDGTFRTIPGTEVLRLCNINCHVKGFRLNKSELILVQQVTDRTNPWRYCLCHIKEKCVTGGPMSLFLKSRRTKRRPDKKVRENSLKKQTSKEKSVSG